MTDITNQEKRTAIEVSEAIERGDYPMADMWPIMARVILATVEAPPKSLAEEVKEAMMFRVNDTDAEGCHHAIDLSDRVEALERGRDHWKRKYDEAHAKVERLTTERDEKEVLHAIDTHYGHYAAQKGAESLDPADGMEWEYAVQNPCHISHWGSRESAEADLEEYLEAGVFPARLIRRPVGPIEVAE